MFENEMKSTPQRSPNLSASKDPELLPRGECSFIMPESELGSSPRQRCSCRTFYPDPVVRSRCGCGHQAWHHEAQPLSAVVTMDEHVAIIEEVKALRNELEEKCKVLERELLNERALRLKMERVWEQQQSRIYQNMAAMTLKLEDKIEAVVDKSQDTHNMQRKLSDKLITVEDFAMELETRLEKLDMSSAGRKSRSMTPLIEEPTPVPERQIAQLPIRTEKKQPMHWKCQVIVVPSKSQRYAYEYDNPGYKRLRSRKLAQEVTFPARDRDTFVNVIECTFKLAFRGRPWMPLTGYRPEDEPFGRIVLTTLPAGQLESETWAQSVIDRLCVVHDKIQGDLLFIALQSEDMTWNEIRFLPPIPGAEESCWEHDDNLDGKVPGFKSLDSELMYDSSEPPPSYSSRAQSQYSARTQSEYSILPPSEISSLASEEPHLPQHQRQPSKLEVLAASASFLSVKQARAQSLRSLSEYSFSDQGSVADMPTNEPTSPPSRMIPADNRSISERSLSIHGPDADSVMAGTDDEHMDKKMRTKMSMPNIMSFGSPTGTSIPSSSAASSISVPPPMPTKMYVSGRSKRKMQVRDGKVKEPVRFTEWKPMQSFRHRMGTNDSNKEKTTPNQQPTQQQLQHQFQIQQQSPL